MNRWIVGVVMTLAMAIGVIAPVVGSTTSVSAADNPKCKTNYLGVTTWYNGLLDDKCNVKPVGNPATNDDGIVVK